MSVNSLPVSVLNKGLIHIYEAHYPLINHLLFESEFPYIQMLL